MGRVGGPPTSPPGRDVGMPRPGSQPRSSPEAQLNTVYSCVARKTITRRTPTIIYANGSHGLTRQGPYVSLTQTQGGLSHSRPANKAAADHLGPILTPALITVPHER